MKKVPSTDRWVKCISTEGNIRGVSIQATDLIQAMADRHGLKGEEILGLGESVLGALLLASHCKQGQRVNLNIQGSGRYQQALVEAYPQGRVRGYVIPRSMANGNDEDRGPWGDGLLSVLRTKDEEGEKPYIGTVPLLTGHLAKDLSFYWVQSEQIPSAVGLAVELEKGKVLSAGGFLVQALPGADSSEVKLIENHIQEIHSLPKNWMEKADPLMLLSVIFQSTPFMIVEEKELEFFCTCSAERVERALMLVGISELQSMLKEDKGAKVKCDFCAKEYQIQEATLEQLIQNILERK